MTSTPRRLALLLVTLALPAALAAQETEQAPEKKFWFTFYGGATFSKFTGSTADTAGLNTRIGYAAGGAVTYEFSPRFGLAAEAGFLQIGAEQEEASRDPGLGYNLTYFELGVSAEFNLAPGAGIQPVLHAGPTLAFEVDCKQPIVYQQVNLLQSNCLNNVEREETEFGGQVGLALRWKMLVLDARYERAFSSLIAGEDLTNQAVIVTLGVRF